MRRDFDDAIPLFAGLSLLIGPLMLFAAVSMIVETFKTKGQMVLDLINIANEGGFGL